MLPEFNIHRLNRPGRYRLTDLFPDLCSYPILGVIFTDAAEIDRILTHTPVLLSDQSHSIFVDNEDGSITIGVAHLQELPDEILYLDIIHELCHVKQHLQGRELYDRSKAYVDRETEIEAYRVTVAEARRIDLTEQAIEDYLRVPWITAEEHRRLCRCLGVGEEHLEKGNRS